MSINLMAKLALEAAITITGTDGKDAHTQDVAFKLACVAMAKQLADK